MNVDKLPAEPVKEQMMNTSHEPKQVTLTGRIQATPDTLLQDLLLNPQFTYELHHLLNSYILIEKVQLLEHERLGLLGRTAVVTISVVLDQITPETLLADPQTNMADIAFAIEQYVEQRVTVEKHCWHIDRSRNDFQTCAQLMFGREQLFTLAECLFVLVQAVHQLAEKCVDAVMPGYTHYQAAQVISPGFYLSALSEELLGTLQRLLLVYDGMNSCPLGAGSMAGQELLWDRERMAHLLGFAQAQRHALVAVASRAWVLQIAAELSTLAVALSRFVTDFIAWGSSEYGFIDLPDELASISSLMPQKKNFTILERIRGKLAHISSFYVDFLLGQRSTAYTNLVEVSKEAGSYLFSLWHETQSALQLLTVVIERMHFREARMRASCEREYLGGSSIANLLTLRGKIPYRTAQVITGRYILLSMEQGLRPTQLDAVLLCTLCQQYGYEITIAQEELQQTGDVDQNLYQKQTAGSANPGAVRTLLALQAEEIGLAQAKWEQRRASLEKAYQDVEVLMVTFREEWEREHRAGKAI